MANINIKTNFVDGEKLFAQQLNNNFKTIQEGMNADNKIIWQDGEEVLFKRYVTNDIENLPILDGSIIYDVEKGRHYIDYNGARIQVGSAGKEVLVQDNEPTEEDNKIWIDTDFVNTMGTEVVDSLDGDETNMAPSVRVVKEKVFNIDTRVNKLETYTEDEVRVGTWFGKPYYRKIITVTNFAVADEATLEHGISNIDEVLPMTRGSMKAISSPYQYHYPLVSHSGKLVDFVVGAEHIMWVGDDYWGSSNSHKIVIYYTKTTDSEVISDEV